MDQADHSDRQAELDYPGRRPNRTPVKGVLDSKDRRQFRRHPLCMEALLIANGVAHPCVIEDLAIGGLRVSIASELPIHTLVKFEDPVAGTMKGKVLRASPGSAIIKISHDRSSAAYMLDLICGRMTPKANS